MRRVPGGVALALVLARAAASPAGLLVDARPSRTDCYIEEDVAGASGSRIVTCLDGGESCDTDGVANGVCVFKVALCPNQTNVPGCTPAPPLTKLRMRSTPGGPCSSPRPT